MNGTPWTEAEDFKLRRYVAQGLLVSTMAELLGRSESSVTGRLYTQDMVEERGYAIKAKRSSSALREAILNAFVRYANHTGIAMEEAQAILMGDCFTAAVPGTERIYKTASIQRLAA